MIRKVHAWLTGWAATLRIRYWQPDLYRQLRGPFDEDDFIEVGPPQ